MFTVSDFRDLVQLLDQHPDWREEMRRLVLTDEVLSLPSAVRELVEAQHRTEARMDQLTERMDQLTERMDQLTVRMDQLTVRMDQLTERMDQLTVRMDQLTERMDQLTERVDQLTVRMDQLTEALTKVSNDVDWLKGDQLERRYRERGPAYFAPLIRHAHVLSSDEWVSLVEGALDQGQISEQEADDLLQTDAIVRGRRREDGTEVYLVVEVSWGVGISDVQRASERAAMLARIGKTSLPVVAGSWVTPDAQEPALAMGVWQVTNGRVIAPQAA